MAITLDTRKGDNTIAIVVTLPNNASTHTVILDFVSDYDKQTTLRHLNVTQSGEWILGVMYKENVPYSGNFKVSIHTSVEDFLALNEIVRSLDQISDPLNDLRGPSKDDLIGIVRAVVLGSDWPFEVQPTAINKTVVEEPALSTDNITHIAPGNILTIMGDPVTIDGEEITILSYYVIESPAENTNVVSPDALRTAVIEPDMVDTSVTSVDALERPQTATAPLSTATETVSPTDNNPKEIEATDSIVTEPEAIDELLITNRK